MANYKDLRYVFPASSIASGTISNSRLNITDFDDNKIVNDISTLGLRVHTQENLNVSNTNSASFDVFNDANGITNLTNTQRSTDEYVSSVTGITDTTWQNFNMNRSSFHNGASGINSSVWSGLDTDIISGNQPTAIGDLGTGGTLKSSGNNNNEWNAWSMDVDLIRWGSGYGWEILLVWENANSTNGYPYMGILGGQNHHNTTNYPNTSGTPSLYNIAHAPNTTGSSAGYSIASGSNGLAIYLNLGYNSGVIGLHEDGNTNLYSASGSGFYYGNRILNRLVYDGAANTLKIFNNENNNSTQVGPLNLHGSSNYNTLPTTGYPYFFAGQHNGTANANNNYQLWYKRDNATANATGSFEGATITAAASTSKMGAVITYQDNAGTNTLNTDIVLKLSADNGSNYSTATLTALPDFATGIKMAKVNDLSVTAGTQLKYKIEFANQALASKEARIRGVSLQY